MTTQQETMKAILNHVELNSETNINDDINDDVYNGACIDGRFKCNINSRLINRYIIFIPYKCCLYYGKTNRRNDTMKLECIDLLCNGVNIFTNNEYLYIQTKSFNIAIKFENKCTQNVWYKYISLSIKNYKKVLKNKDGIISGVLYKFKGNKLRNIKYDKRYIKTKYVIYLKNINKLIYCDNNNKNTKIIKVNSISTWISKNSSNISKNMPCKFKDIWFKINTNKRIIIFGTKNYNDIKYWYRNINKSLNC